MIVLLVISQLYFFYFMYEVFDKIEIKSLNHKVFIGLSFVINLILILISLFFIYNV